MTPAERQERILAVTKRLDHDGIGVYELFSWPFLLDLRERYKGEVELDLDILLRARHDIDAALWWKAQCLDGALHPPGSEAYIPDPHQDLLRKLSVPDTRKL